jgi:hypothetical protein
MPRRGNAPPLPCGTNAAYTRHKRAGEPACKACLAAHTAYTIAYERAHRITTPPKACGTYGGYKRHNRAKTLPCQPCLEANRAYQRKVRIRRLIAQVVAYGER